MKLSKEDETRLSVRILLNGMRDRGLAKFVQVVIDECENYYTSPGSTKNHHSYKGGLAYHSVSAAVLGSKICNHYKALGIKVSDPIVVAGILLHDIGKAYCYKWASDRTENGKHIPAGYTYTRDNNLFHHIPIGFELVSRIGRKFNEEHGGGILGEKKLGHLLHIILSHHGRRAWSSPVTPQTIEAFIVHSVESMDGHVEKFSKGEIPRTLYDGVSY